ncbi:hypothetical protein ACFCX4_29055 [Kitasatospora sp. NPDC056327]|uniref:hypothetical protein n=1 Tax=Kitasatospora sp. NPDC056327 TaxID=3345785 RepID=UPI0035D7119A
MRCAAYPIVPEPGPVPPGPDPVRLRLRLRLTLGLRREGGHWTAAHAHRSFPGPTGAA